MVRNVTTRPSEIFLHFQNFLKNVIPGESPPGVRLRDVDPLARIRSPSRSYDSSQRVNVNGVGSIYQLVIYYVYRLARCRDAQSAKIYIELAGFEPSSLNVNTYKNIKKINSEETIAG